MEFILYEKAGSIATITLNRPEALNAFHPQMMEELIQCLDTAQQDLDIRCLVLFSAGKKAFTAGGDIKVQAALSPETAKTFADLGKRCILSILHHRVPVICAAHGYTLGGGMELVLASDITIAASNLSLGVPTIRLGAIPAWGSTVLLPLAVGASKAKEILYTGLRLKAEEACQLGLVEMVVEPEKLLSSAMALAETIADMPPIAIEYMKQSVNNSAYRELDPVFKAETGYFSACFETEDRREAMDAFLVKRQHGKYHRR